MALYPGCQPHHDSEKFEEQDDRENEQVFHSVCSALVPDGTFIMDYFNADQVAANLITEDTQEQENRVIKNQRRITDDRKRVEKTVTVIEQDGHEQVFHESVRLYRGDDLNGLARKAGFTKTTSYGSFKGEPFSTGSSRLVLVCEK